jgi:peptidoglycan/LPS O-acetylase OafA/YrhL
MNPNDESSVSVKFNYVPTLDGWRALSVLAVIYFHCIHNGLNPGSIWSRLAIRAHFGVDVFFAISGFLICGKLLQELSETKTISLKHFYLRRCFRILPPVCAYLAVLALLTAVGWAISERWEFGSTLLFVRNYFPLFHDSVFGTYTAQFWSLAVEEHFYLLWPITMLLLGPNVRRIGWVALGSALAVFAWRTIDAAHGWFIPFASDVASKTDTRIDALLWGCLAAIVYPYLHTRLKHSPIRRQIWLPISLLVLAVIFLKNIPGGSLLIAILFPVLLMCTAIAPDSILGRFLELPIMKWTGMLSYSIYIWQQLAIFPIAIASSPLRVLQHFPYNIAVIFLVASISYYLIERPMIRIGYKLTPRAQTEPSQPVSVVFQPRTNWRGGTPVPQPKAMSAFSEVLANPQSLTRPSGAPQANRPITGFWQ